MTDAFTPDASVDTMVQWLLDSAKDHGDRRAERLYLEERRKSVLAEAYDRLPSDMPVGAKEKLCYKDQAYQAHLDAMARAIRADEINRLLRQTIMAKLDLARSQMATDRYLMKSTI